MPLKHWCTPACRRRTECMTSPHSRWYLAALQGATGTGPRTPCGMPNNNWTTVDSYPLNQTCWVQPCRNDCSHASAVPQIPNDCCSWQRRMSWSTQSKAVLRSNRPSSMTSLQSLQSDTEAQSPLSNGAFMPTAVAVTGHAPGGNWRAFQRRFFWRPYL